MTENPQRWKLERRFRARTGVVCLAVVGLLAYSGNRTEMGRAAAMTGHGVLDGIGVSQDSEVGTGFRRFMDTAFPLVLNERRRVSRIENFDPERLPPLAYLVEEPVREYDIESGEFVDVGTAKYLVQPGGYLGLVLLKMMETLEIAVWGTLLSVLLSLPLTYWSAANYTPHSACYVLGRGLCSLTRAIPELIIAMFLVLMYGFGPIPGVLALGIHTSGFLGKFFADDIENCDRGPQEALRSTGASKLKVLRFAVVPQIFPQCLAYVQYILERNVRMAAVLGVVGAGGIGMELKGRWDLSDFGHVSTILLVIFVTVMTLENVTQRFRRRAIQ